MDTLSDITSQFSILNSQFDKHQVFVITGPTAVGKSAFGAALAEKIGGEVVSADSMQIYKFMDIGTAKPGEEEKRGIKHHMLDIVPPWEDYSVARYIEDAAGCVDDILGRGKKAVIVGGTGLYIDSLISGRVFSKRGDAALRRKLEAQYDAAGGEAMLRELHQVDPDCAQKLHANDKKRIVRALEVYETTGKPISLHDTETRALPPRYAAAKFALMLSDRAKLYEHIDMRVDMMLAKGFVNEVRMLLDMGVAPNATSMQAIGYKELAAALRGGCGMDDAVEKIKMESRRYAKRQLTWLRRDKEINWLIKDVRI